MCHSLSLGISISHALTVVSKMDSVSIERSIFTQALFGGGGWHFDPCFRPLGEWVASAMLIFTTIQNEENFQFWHLRELNLWPTRKAFTRNPLDRESKSERRMVHSSVEVLLGDILEPKVTCQRTFVRFHTMFSIMKTMTKCLLGMYIMTNIT